MRFHGDRDFVAQVVERVGVIRKIFSRKELHISSLAARLIAVREKREFLSPKGRRTAKKAIGLAMAAGGVGHGCLQNSGCQLSAISSQLRPNSELVQAAGMSAVRVQRTCGVSAPTNY